MEATAETTLIAEALALAVGERLEPGRLKASSGLQRDEPLERTGPCEGHLFVVVTERGVFSDLDRIAVTVKDLAWVLVAADDVARNGGVLDETRVNRVRYLEGTPKGSTRWIDTGWAIALASG